MLTTLLHLTVCTTHFKDNFDASLIWKKGKADGIMKIQKHGLLPFKGLVTTTDYKFYHYSTPIDSFSTKSNDLVLQFAVTFEQSLNCGGGYLKLIPSTPSSDFDGDSPYFIMFGPDICGPTKKVHVILHYKDKNHAIKHHISAPHDTLMHVYTLIIHKDQSYDVLVDHKSVQSGLLVDDFDTLLPPKQILDPNAAKPDNWDDRPKIPDTTDVKPEDWDDIPQYIDDPDHANKPEDWDDEMDGEYEVAQIVNPEYKGEWKPKMVENPEYKGEWEHPMIDNPEYVLDKELHVFNKVGGLGIDVWQVEAGTLFSHVLLTDSVEDAEEEREKLMALKEEEEGLKKEADAKKAEEDAKKAEEEAEENKEEEDKEEL